MARFSSGRAIFFQSIEFHYFSSLKPKNDEKNISPNSSTDGIDLL